MKGFDRSQLTPHFQNWEFTVSDTAVRRGIHNTPSMDEWDNLKALALKILEPAREACGPLQITSGYRCPALNTAIGGAANSQHIKGEAADIIPYQGTLVDLFKWIYAQNEYDQLIWEFGQWIHVSYKRSAEFQRHECLVASKVNGKTRYAPITPEHMASL